VSKPSFSYVVCATPRSGSNLLCEALTLSGVAGVPQEYFLHWMNPQSRAHREPADFLDEVLALGTGPNGVFGMKMMWGGFDVFISTLRTIVAAGDLPPWEVLARVFPNPSYIYITREDKIRQAVSLARARQSDRWVRFKEGATQGNYARQYKERLEAFFEGVAGLPRESESALAYDFQQIRTIYTMLLEHECAWEQFFADAGVRPHRVVYEHLAARYEGTTVSLLSNMGLSAPAGLPCEDRVLDQQGDQLNDDWSRRFAEDLCAGRGLSGGGA